MKRLRFRGFGTTTTGVLFGKHGMRPKCTGGGVVGSVCLTGRFVALLPSVREPRRAANCRKFCRLVNVRNRIRRYAISCVVHSRSQTGFRRHGGRVRHLITQVGARCNRNAMALRLHSRCCGVHRGVRPMVRVVSVTFTTVRTMNIGPGIGPVHKNASNTRLSFGNLPYPGVFTNNLGFRKHCRFIPVRGVRGTVGIVIGVTRLMTSE